MKFSKSRNTSRWIIIFASFLIVSLILWNTYNFFQIFKERNQIQLDQTYSVENIVLQYVSDGQEADAATQIDPYAIKTITNPTTSLRLISECR